MNQTIDVIRLLDAVRRKLPDCGISLSASNECGQGETPITLQIEMTGSINGRRARSYHSVPEVELRSMVDPIAMLADGAWHAWNGA